MRSRALSWCWRRWSLRARGRRRTAAAPGVDPGVTSNSILIGGTFPLSGEAATAATIAKGADAYFKYVNARGGVNGRKITFKYLDDGYDPGRAVNGTRQLVLQDKVFAIFGSLGTEQNLATRPILNQLGVPQLFVSSGASTWGRDAKRYPWTIGFIPTYPTEARMLANYILAHQTKPKPRIAVLYQGDAYGQDIYNGFKRALGRKRSLIVASKAYDPTSPDVRSEVARLRASKANTFMIFAFGKFAIQAFYFARQARLAPEDVRERGREQLHRDAGRHERGRQRGRSRARSRSRSTRTRPARPSCATRATCCSSRSCGGSSRA